MGHVVICDGLLMQLDRSYRDLPDGGVLVFGSSGTVFRTKGRAQKAVRRTVRYALARGLKWPVLDSTKVKIKRVQEES